MVGGCLVADRALASSLSRLEIGTGPGPGLRGLRTEETRDVDTRVVRVGVLDKGK